MLPEAVLSYLSEHRDRHLGQLMELLRLPSVANVSAEPDGCAQAAEWLARCAGGLGLEARVVATAGKPAVLATGQVGPDRPTVLIYGHYDVQPPEPLEQWDSPPFAPEVRDGCLYARGASDDKGQLFAHLMAIEAWQHAGGGLPVNVKLFLEGEEEIGSPNVERFVAEHRDELSADAAVISDSAFFADGVPSITCSLRGLVYLELTVTGPAVDIHSGTHGGAVTNPINALARILAAAHDGEGRVTLPGFYDDVQELTEQERGAWAGLAFDERAYAASLGVEELGGGERAREVLERRWARPTLDCNGIVGGYTAAGSKTIIPARASAKLSMRLVPTQDPERVVAGFGQFVARHVPPGVQASFEVHARARPVMLDRHSPAMGAARRACVEAFGREPAMIRCGASVPVTEVIQRLLGLDAVMMGFGLPDDNLHSPNEHFRLEHLWRGSAAAAALMHNLLTGRADSP